MKHIGKILSILAVCFTMGGFSQVAHAQTMFTWNSYQPNALMLLNGNYGGSYMVALQDATIGFDVKKLAAVADGASFSVFTYDAKGNILSEKIFTDLSKGSNFSMDVSQGAMIGYSITGNNMVGQTMTGMQYYGTLDYNTDTFLMKFHLDDTPAAWQDWWNTQIDVRVSVRSASAPSGQPLPGVLLSCMFASIAGIPLYAKFKKKQSKVS